jgi:hypothetical protein
MNVLYLIHFSRKNTFDYLLDFIYYLSYHHLLAFSSCGSTKKQYNDEIIRDHNGISLRPSLYIKLTSELDK